MVDGEHWEYGRTLTRSRFGVVHPANSDRLRRRIDVFVKILPIDGSN
jgi:hypothetical protein